MSFWVCYKVLIFSGVCVACGIGVAYDNGIASGIGLAYDNKITSGIDVACVILDSVFCRA
jgi:hypothetical protein